MLVIFVFGITPKRFLHNAFAKHIDNSSQSATGKPFQLTTSGYNCDCDNLVAESTFLNDLQVFSFPLSFSYSCYTIKDISFISTTKVYSLLRGPPVKLF